MRFLAKLFSLTYLILLIVLAFALSALADPSGTPSPAPGGVGGYVQSQGGLVGTVLAIVAAYLAVMTAIHEVCQKLKLGEPSWVQKSAEIGATITGYLSGNTRVTKS